MTTVNIIRDDVFLKQGVQLHGEIKTISTDFEVRELHSHRPVSNASNQHDTKGKNESVFETSSEMQTDSAEADEAMELHGLSYLEKVLSSDVIKLIADVSKGYQETLQSVQCGNGICCSSIELKVGVLLPVNMSKKQRGSFHVAIKESFPFLKTVAMKSDECLQQFHPLATCTQTSDFDISDDCELNLDSEALEQDVIIDESRMGDVQQNIAGIWVSADSSLIELAECAISMEDIAAIYAFKTRGPHHENARTGVKIGLGLSRDERTKVYRIVTSKCLSLDSKTTDDRMNKKHIQRSHAKKRNSQQAGLDDETPSADSQKESKSMIIFWRKKAAFLKNKNENGGDEAEATSGCAQLHVGFTLTKVNTEHLAALQLLATAAGTAASDISFCGIKDKKAVTYQQCVLTVRSDWNTRSDNKINEEHSSDPKTNQEHSSDAARDCLEGVALGSLRDRVASIIDCLLLSFSPKDTTRGTGQTTYTGADSTSSAYDSRGHIAVSGFHLVSSPLRIGDLWGNRFQIKIRNIRCAEPEVYSVNSGSGSKSFTESGSSSIDPRVLFLERMRSVAVTGFPNFFGAQRMGYQEPQTLDRVRNLEPSGSPLGPTVGKLLLLGRYRDAVDAVILGTSEYRVKAGFSGDGCSGLHNARDMYYRGFEPGAVLSVMPRAAVKERMLLKAMVRFGWHQTVRENKKEIEKEKEKEIENNDEDNTEGNTTDEKNNEINFKIEELSGRILGQIPHSTRSLWVSAYQSWLWNNVASFRLLETDLDPQKGAQNSVLDSQKRPDFGDKVGDLCVRAMEGDLVHLSGLKAVLSGVGNIREGELEGIAVSVREDILEKEEEEKIEEQKQKHQEGEDRKEEGGRGEEGGKEEQTEGGRERGGDGIHADCALPTSKDISSPLNPLIKPPVETSPKTDDKKMPPIIDPRFKTQTPTCPTQDFPPKPAPNDMSDPVIVLTKEHTSSMTDMERIYLFRHSIVLPLFGKKILYPDNNTGRYYLGLLKREGFGDLNDPQKPQLGMGSDHISPLCMSTERNAVRSDLDSRPIVPVPRGAYRKIMQQVSNAQLTDPENAENKSVNISNLAVPLPSITATFALPAGSYATAFLREIMKNNAFI